MDDEKTIAEAIADEAADTIDETDIDQAQMTLPRRTSTPTQSETRSETRTTTPAATWTESWPGSTR